MNQIIHIGLDGELRNSLENPALSLDDPKTWEENGLMGEPTSTGITVNQKTAMGYPALFRAISLISGDVGRLPFAVYRRLKDGGKEVDKDHPAYVLLRRRANPFLLAMTFRETMTAHALLRGNGFAAIIRDGAGRPRELVILDPDVTYPVTLTDDTVGSSEIWYLTTVGTEPKKFRSRDVLHIRGLSHNGLCGIDVMSLMAEALSLGMATRKWVCKFFGNGTNVSGVLMVPENMKKEKVDNVQRNWEKAAEGLKNTGKVAMLHEGVKFLPLSSKPEEAAAVGLLENEVMTVSNITGVPPHKLGDKSRTSYNSLEIESQHYLDDCLDRWLCEWEAECAEKLLSPQELESESHFMEFNRNARLRMDATARWGSYDKGRATGVYSVNDINRIESRPTIGPEGDKRHIPANWTELTAGPPATPAPQPTPAPPAKSSKNVRNACRDALLPLLNRKADIEREKVAKVAARTPQMDWFAWGTAFYREHEEHLLDSVLPLCGLLEAADDSELIPEWKKAVATHCEARKAALNSCTDVAEVVSGWSGRDLLDLLLPETAPEGTP
ncbi:phage portal protein [Planctomyces sp. SH-PL14]|uniref:phage portal protein n=1 Tax=Planctomyces sp. SH-PL14 TaxID=1632864 RepID=UPI00078C067F|nr:phage portal protein [Planctomyces sp. SH-PL14]AMV20419.1 Phage portal protein [Planctomyces sp. SH-PL14]